MNYFRCGGGRSIHTATKLDFAKSPIATFSSNVSGLNLAEVLAYITASQSGTGTPSPSNPRPITGHTQAVVTNKETTYTTPFGQTIYGGVLNVTKGLLTITMGTVDLGSLNWNYYSSGNRFSSTGISSLIKAPATDSTVANILSDRFDVKSLTALRSSANDNLIAIGDTGGISVRYTTSGTDATAFKSAVSGVMLVYELATPQTIQLTPQEIEQYLQNTLWASTGDVSGKYYRVD